MAEDVGLGVGVGVGVGGGARFFKSTWKTNNAGTSGSDQITLPLESGGVYDFMVDWGDGGAPERIQAWNAAAKTHTFAGGAGTYTVTIWGRIQGWTFNNTGDKLKILSILSWGPLRLGNSTGYFYGCTNLTIPATDTLDMTGTTTMSVGFFGCNSITTFPSLATLDTSQVTNMANMFNSCYAFNQSISNFDTSKVTDMNRMFQRCDAFNQSISNFDTSKVTNFEQMFYQASVFNQSVSSFNTAKVTNMASMFAEALLFNQDVSGFNVELVTNMFNFCNSASLSRANYDALLIAWAAQAVKDSVAFHAGDAKYTPGGAAEAARTHLVTAVGSGGHGWTITDGGAF